MPNFPITRSTPGQVRPLYFYALHRLQPGPSTGATRYRSRNAVTPRTLENNLEFLEVLTIAEEASPDPSNLITTEPAPAVDIVELEEPEGLALPEGPTPNASDLVTNRPAVADDTVCVICLSEFEIGNTVSETVCMHKFHQECLAKWFQYADNCPICRTDLQENSDGEQEAASHDEN